MDFALTILSHLGREIKKQKNPRDKNLITGKELRNFLSKRKFCQKALGLSVRKRFSAAADAAMDDQSKLIQQQVIRAGSRISSLIQSSMSPTKGIGVGLR